MIRAGSVSGSSLHVFLASETGWTDSIKYWCRADISKNHPLLYFSRQQTAQILVPSLWDSYAFLDWSLIFGLSTLQLILDMVARL